MEIFFGYQFETFTKNERLEGLLNRAVRDGVITSAGAAYVRNLAVMQ